MRPLLAAPWALAPICFSSVDEDSRVCGTGLGVLLCGKKYTLSAEPGLEGVPDLSHRMCKGPGAGRTAGM